MNIGIVTTWFERGAAYVSRQFKEVLDFNNSVYIYARGGEYQGSNDKNWNGHNVTWDRQFNIPIETFIEKKNFMTWLSINKIELVLFNEQRWWPPILWCNDAGIKTGAYIDYYTEATIEYFEVYDFLICNTKRHYEVFKWHPQCFYIPWGTNLDLFKPTLIEKKDVKNIIFFHSAGMNPIRKGTDILIKAFSRLNGNAKLVIHTQVNLEFNDLKLNELITILKRENKIEIINKTIHAPGIYDMGDVYVYPTRLEGIGLTIVEAIACGLPTIVPNYPPMNEFIDGKNGKLVDIERVFSRDDGYYWPQCIVNIDDLIDKMQYYITNFKYIKDMKNETRLIAEKKFDWTKNSFELNSIINKIKKNDSEKIKILSTFLLSNKNMSYSKIFSLIANNPKMSSMFIKSIRRIL